MNARPPDPNWPTAAAWLRGQGASSPRGKLGLIGVPLFRGSITTGRCDLAPAAVRAVLERFSTFDIGDGADLRDVAVRDYGDLDVTWFSPAGAHGMVAAMVAEARRAGEVAVLLGGDNSVTRPGVAGLDAKLSNCALLTLDAHLDLRDLDGGPTNGNPVRGLLADGVPGTHISQIGIQPFANSAAYAQVARAANIEVVDIEQVRARGIVNVVNQSLGRLAALAQQIYVDIDMDVLDRAFAPGCPGSRPGGLTPGELQQAARRCGAHPKVAAVDFVEVDPSKDVADTTVMATASCLLAFAAGYRSRPGA